MKATHFNSRLLRRNFKNKLYDFLIGLKVVFLILVLGCLGVSEITWAQSSQPQKTTTTKAPPTATKPATQPKTSPHMTKGTEKSAPISRYILSWSEIQKLPLEQRVRYFRFLHVFLAEVERQQIALLDSVPDPSAQTAPRSRHYAALEFLHYLLMPPSVARQAANCQYENWKTEQMIGCYCIYGGYPSAYEARSGDYYCRPQGVGSCSPINGQEAIQCNPRLFIPRPGPSGSSPICVTRQPENQSARASGLTARCVTEFERQLGGMTVQRALELHLVDSIRDPNQEAAWNAWKNDMQKALDEFEHTSFRGYGFRNYCGDDMRNTANKGRQEEECQALNRLFFNLGQEIPQLSQAVSEHPTASTTEISATPVPVASSPGIQEGNQPQEPRLYPPPVAPHPPSQTEVIPPGQGIVWNDPPATPSAPASGMEHLGDLACVAQAIQEARGESATNWVAFMGIMAQKFGGPYRLPNQKKALQQRVIEMISSYSYCSDQDYPVTSTRSNPNMRDWLYGRTHVTSSNEREVLNTLGIPNYNMTLLDTLFNPRVPRQSFFSFSRKGFDEMEFHERRYHFAYYNSALRQIPADAAMHQCRRSVAHKLNHDPTFTFCNWRNQVIPENIASNENFCAQLAGRCGLKTNFCQIERKRCPELDDSWLRGGDGPSGGAPAGGGPGNTGKGGEQGSSGGGATPAQ